MVNTQLVATQQQLMHLQHRYDELQQGHVALMNHVSGLRDVLRRHDGAMRGVLRHLAESGRKGRGGGYGNGIGIQDLVGNGPDDHPASPLLQVSQLLGEFSNNESLFTRDLDQLQNGMQYRNHSEYSTPSGSNEPGGGSGSGGGGLAQTPTSAVQDGMGSYGNTTSYDLDNMVYPVGQINGIDPINSEHINNIPYSFPPSGSLATQSQAVVAQGGGGLGQGGLEKALSGRVGGRKPMQESIWGPHTPRILLVEDDKTCARVGCKFLESFRCHVDIARHGLEAVEKMNAVGNGDGPGGPGYDLILMDIIMPHLDGISATVCIRGGGWTGPVVAMTSNIRADDIEMYFKYGKCESVTRASWGEGEALSLPHPNLTLDLGEEKRRGERGTNRTNKHRHERRPPQALHERRYAPFSREAPSTIQARLYWATARWTTPLRRLTTTGSTSATGAGSSSTTTAGASECSGTTGILWCADPGAVTEWTGWAAGRDEWRDARAGNGADEYTTTEPRPRRNGSCKRWTGCDGKWRFKDD